MTLAYDPLKRLYSIAGASTTRFAYDGANAIAEYNSLGALQRRYVFAGGQPILQYEGTGTSSRYFMSSDERGSIVSVTDGAGALVVLNRYDEYGKPQSTNIGRFQYTGQMWLSELGAYNYKARVYLPHLGIFAQTDPAGYDPSPNLYAYVKADPLNAVDPSGMVECNFGGPPTDAQIAACEAQNAAFYANYQAGPSFDSSYMAAVSGSYAANSLIQSYTAGLTTGYFACTNCGIPSPGGTTQYDDIKVTSPQYVWVSTGFSLAGTIQATTPSTPSQPNATTTPTPKPPAMSNCTYGAYYCGPPNPSTGLPITPVLDPYTCNGLVAVGVGAGIELTGGFGTVGVLFVGGVASAACGTL